MIYFAAFFIPAFIASTLLFWKLGCFDPDPAED